MRKYGEHVVLEIKTENERYFLNVIEAICSINDIQQGYEWGGELASRCTENRFVSVFHGNVSSKLP